MSASVPCRNVSSNSSIEATYTSASIRPELIKPGYLLRRQRTLLLFRNLHRVLPLFRALTSEVADDAPLAVRYIDAPGTGRSSHHRVRWSDKVAVRVVT